MPIYYTTIVTVIALMSVGLMLFYLHLGLLTVAAVSGGRPPGDEALPGPGATRFRILVPAHDEEASIRTVIESCRAIDYDPDRFEVVVIADNCTDRTAEIARASGAQVFERSNLHRRGKGQALGDFLDREAASIAGRSFDAVLVIDADSVADPGILRALDREIAGGSDWLQGYSTSSNPEDSRWTQLTTYTLALINGVHMLGSQRLGLGAAFRGNGMCFTSRGLERISWRAGGLAEDLEFTWKLRVVGERVRFVPEAVVRSEMVRHLGSAAATQRKRWESGRRTVRGQFLIPLLRSRAIGVLQKALLLIDLCAPPLSSLLLALMALACVDVLGLLDPEIMRVVRILLPIHAAMALALACYVLSPVFLMRVPARYLFSVFAATPRFVAWKLLATGGRPAYWVRTARGPIIEATDLGGR